METICGKHDEISKIACNKFYRGSLSNIEDPEELRDIIWDMERAMYDIDSLVWEAKNMWQRMEGWLHRRKDLMQEYDIEQFYKS